jgi:hypothetical protein
VNASDWTGLLSFILILVNACLAILPAIDRDMKRESARMINMRYKKLSGMHAGHSFVVVAPYGEIETPMRWMLHMEGPTAESLVAAEDELTDTRLWQSLN